ncbi:DUF1310 family protein [Streptococcus intermedius]|uniref:DUF1310 family protein n=1 Tax=Streptococcus intermedius TaxID=1338 RepID=A0AAD1FK05_STRIT|nr:DUF1310 family protein [Streptococcus intermedius]RSJ03057.1 hypothetical protein D8895_13740 [Streptococcus sp. BCA20]BAW17743.1 hypothetical protein SITYG_17660 [Streptococcus intermedius]
MKKVLLILGAVLLGTMIAIGGCKVQEKSQKEQMLEIVKSDEARVKYKEVLKNLDKNAFTDKGIIHSYEIDEKSVSHNPMGGIFVTLYINGDKELELTYLLDKDPVTKKFRPSSSSTSQKLSELLKERGEK